MRSTLTSQTFDRDARSVHHLGQYPVLMRDEMVRFWTNCSEAERWPLQRVKVQRPSDFSAMRHCSNPLRSQSIRSYRHTSSESRRSGHAANSTSSSRFKRFGDHRDRTIFESVLHHSRRPQAAQALNTSVDVLSLAWKLGLSLQGSGNPSLVNGYGEVRLQVTLNMINFGTEWEEMFVQGESRNGEDFYATDKVH